MALKVMIKKARLSYPHLFERDNNGKYSCALLIPKTDTATIKALRAAEAEATKEQGPGKWGGKKANKPSVIKDGDETSEDYPERAGQWMMAVRSDRKPGVVDTQVNPILDQDEVYAGCYVNVTVNAFAYHFDNTSRGISFGLGNVQKVAEGEPFGNITKAEDDFTEVDDADLI